MTFRLRETDLAWNNIGGELVAADMRAEQFLKGNRTAILLFEMLEEGATQAELAERLVAKFDIGYERALSDVDGFLTELRAAGLLAG